MKRNISNILMLPFLLLGMTACEVETLSTVLIDDNGNEELTFSFNARATATNENESSSEIDLNEDKIETLDLFFFNANGEDTYLAHHQFTNANSDKNTTYTVNIPSNGLDMNGNTQYRIYAVANRVITPEETPTYTLNGLKSMAANKVIGTGNNAVQASFVMDGEITTALSSNMTTPVINLARSVAKITLDINVADELVIGSNNVKYTPVENSMTVRMIRGVEEGIINGFTNPVVYFEDANGNPTSRSITEVADGNDHTPFYSYPYDWSSKSTDDDCYLYLTIDWLSSLGNQRTYYYIVPIGEVTQLVRNNHYKINLNVAILGGTEDIPVTLRSNYIIENWSTREISTELKKYRYLWVENTSYEMKNTTELKIPYATSHPTERIIVSCKQPNLYTNKDEEYKTQFSSTNPDANFYCALVDGNIVYRHPLENDYTKDNFDFTPYEIEITIQHIDNEDGVKNEMSETIKITQYPAIYAEAEANSDYNDDSHSNNSNDHNDNCGYMFVNGYNNMNSRNTQDFFCSAPGLASNIDYDNPTYNMFVITVTSVNGTDYLLGDPREKTVNQNFISETHTQNNRSYSIWQSAPSTEGATSRILTNYLATEVNNSLYANNDNTVYPNDAAAEAGERTVKMLAPKFRVASSYAVLDPSATEAEYLHYMKKRCASYQEDGYPAGRWRLPTRAEFQFIVYLSYKEKIPTLYSPTSNYWCAHGYGKPSNGNVNMNYKTRSDGNSVRCVYDEWYWGSEKIADKTKFTWGDEPITQK